MNKVREYYYERFEHILVDEYQDTNLAQYKLVNMLYTNMKSEIPPKRSLCVVGDVDQSIYSWRGADYTIIMNFQRDFRNAKLIKLEQNYRSTANILNVANAIIENNTERVDKVLYSNKGEGELIDYFEAQDESDEANFIISKIKNESCGNYNQYAILYRTNSQSRALEEACMASGIPYRIYGGLKFYDRKEIKDIIAYLKLIYNPDDSQSFKRIVNVPKRAIGDTTIKRLQNFADMQDISLFEAAKRIEDQQREYYKAQDEAEKERQRQGRAKLLEEASKRDAERAWKERGERLARQQKASERQIYSIDEARRERAANLKRPGYAVPDWQLETRRSGESLEDYAIRADRSRRRNRGGRT